MTKRDLVIKVAKQANLKQNEVMDVLQMALDAITEELAQGHNIEFRNFGVFEVMRRKARIGRNPNAPENEVTIPERMVVKFKPGKEMRQQVLRLKPVDKKRGAKGGRAKSAK